MSGALDDPDLAPVSRMHRWRRAAIVVVCLLCVACGTGTKPHSPLPPGAPQRMTVTHPLIGIGDNNVSFFSDPRFRALGITTVRDDIPWNVLQTGGYARARLTQWLAAAHAAHLTVLITFDRAGRRLPSVADYSADFLEFRKLYPWVTEFVTWDEANFYNEPTATHPGRVARFYLALRGDCPQCTVLAPDLLDIGDRDFAVPEVKYAREIIDHLHAQPAYWALNDYVGANDLSTASTRQLLNVIDGKVWIAEVAGIISNGTHVETASAGKLAQAARVDSFIFEKLAPLSPRIQRIYLYEWQAATSRDVWDSALVSADGVPRPAYDVLANWLDARGVEPDCAISRAPPACSASK